MKDAVQLTSDLIRFDTTSPPGNERGCAALRNYERLIADWIA